MNARMRRLASDYEQVKKDFAGHSNIIVTPIGQEPPEKYHVTYFVNGIYLSEDGRIETLNRHEVEITLHADYPRYKPICSILTPIWHPNFRDGQICIGDIWGAGESLTDIIINIGDMIQYKSWNSYSPLSADAAQWAMENKHLFPVGNIDLYIADYASAADDVEIDLFDEESVPYENAENTSVEETAGNEGTVTAEEGTPNASSEPIENLSNKSAKPIVTPQVATPVVEETNDFEITAEELAGVEFVPTVNRMQTVSNANAQGSKKGINFKTIFTKGILWALIGGIVGFIVQEVLSGPTDSTKILSMMGYNSINDLLYMDENTSLAIIERSVRISTGLFSAFVACGLGLFLGIGEGVFYGSKDNAIKYGAIGAGLSLVIGFISGDIAQYMYSNMLSNSSSIGAASLVRGIGWAIMGLGVGLSIGLIKPEKKRVLYCGIGGTVGGFIGGLLFNTISSTFSTGADDSGVVARGIGIVIMGVLIGLGIGLLEQVGKEAWLKVIRGEFEGKEYLVFAGTTSIGSNGKNTIVLFKDKLVAPNHCNIVQEGGKYVLYDKGSPMGTIVNGQKVSKHVLRQGDAIAIGNSVLVFNTK